MKAKEKALELYNKFFNEANFVETRDGGEWDNCTLTEESLKSVAKQCALICAKELQSELAEINVNEKFNISKYGNYWAEVKQEIEKIK